MLETEPSVDTPTDQKLMDDRVRAEAVELLITGGAVDVVPTFEVGPINCF